MDLKGGLDSLSCAHKRRRGACSGRGRGSGGVHTSAGGDGFRGHYNAHGVDGYYELHGAAYSNPHEARIRVGLPRCLDDWAVVGDTCQGKSGCGAERAVKMRCVLDLACGTGEATAIVREWAQKRGASVALPSWEGSDRPAAGSAVDEEHAVTVCELDGAEREAEDAHQLASTRPIRGDVMIWACDPYTHSAFQKRHGSEAAAHSFADVASGCLEGMEFSLVICCFSLHLADKGLLFSVCSQLAMVSEHLLVITPHKRPELEERMGWELATEQILERIRYRLYRSLLRS